MKTRRLVSLIGSVLALVIATCFVGCPTERTPPAKSVLAAPRLNATVGGITARVLDPEQDDNHSTAAAQPARPLRKDDAVVVSFATPMVAASAVDSPLATAPVEIAPALPFRFRWRSQTEGELTVTGIPAPATSYRLRLRTGLTDAANRPVAAPAWGLQWPDANFVVRLPWSPYSGQLPAQPSLTLDFSHLVAAAEVARTAVWRDEEGHATASDVQLAPTLDPQAATRFTVTPRRPLPTDHRYELLVENTTCAIDGSRLAYVHVFPLGRTESLQLESVAGYHQPVLGTFLELKFNQAIDPASVALKDLSLSPSVANLRLEIDWGTLRVFGDFDPSRRYRVDLAAGVRSRRGFPLKKPETWHAHFGDKRPAVIIPRSVVTTSAHQGLSLDLVQLNTTALHWRLARVPTEAISTVRARLDEYRELDNSRRDPATNEHPLRQTELLVPALHLPIVAEGDFDATATDREVPRNVAFAPDRLSEGTYLFEIAGNTKDGRIAGNRVLVLMNREFFVWKTTRDGLLARLFDVVTGDPVQNAEVQVLATDGRELARARTDADGQATLPALRSDDSATLVLVRRGDSVSAHFVDSGGGIPQSRSAERDEETDDEHATAPTALRQWLFSDRGIYRPGEILKAKGIVRSVADGKLALPEAGIPVAWQLIRSTQDEPLLSGETTLNAAGAWETEIALPATMPTGHYVLRALGTSCPVKVDEFRAPPFAAEATELATAPAGESRIRVASRYFHGAPNARAAVRWRAVWSPFTPYPAEELIEPGRWLSTNDSCSPERELQRPRWARDHANAEHAESDTASRVFEGTAVLDATGVVELVSHQPFAAARRLAAASVSWEIAVIAPDGQTVEVEHEQVLPIAPAQPATSLSASPGAHVIDVVATAIDTEGKLTAGTPLKVQLFHVAEKSVRENLSRHVVRYRNTPLFTPVATREVTAPFRGSIPVESTGRFVAVVTLAGMANSPQASNDVSVSGAAPAEFAQWDDSNFEAKPDRTEYPVGATAHVALRAPFAGKAWVTVESDRLLYSNFVQLSGNAASVEIPVTPAMHPNAHVEIYLFRPESQGLAAERRAHCQLHVVRPETELHLTTELATPKVEPGNSVTGAVTVATTTGPAADAEVTLFAVDEAVLQYVGWSLGSSADIFFPPVSHSVDTRSSLRQFGPRPPDEPLFQKGFLLGDGAGRSAGFRRRFAALAFWQGDLHTDRTGRAAFAFVAPDNLTAYRIVAVAHRGTEQFGHGAKLVEVARRLQAEPALPRFVRHGDTADLRVLLRQNEWPTLDTTARCSVSGATLALPAPMPISLVRAIPTAAVYPATIGNGTAPVRVQFSVQAKSDPDASDAVEISVPVKPARITRRETVAGLLPESATITATNVPADWGHGIGAADLIVSSSPWLPVFDGLPRLLDYPHGCDEQISARVLAYALMADLLDALPDGASRIPEYRKRVETGLALLARAQLPDGDMPYWPGTKVGNPFVTIQTAWAAAEAERSGFHVSAPLLEGLQNALRRIARREDRVRVEPTLRAFALMVSATLEPGRKLRAEALDVFQQRDALDDDGRAFLALALHRFGIMAEEKRQLVAELGTDLPEREFTVSTLGSAARTTALRLLARSEIASSSWTAEARAEKRRHFCELLASSPNFSTQENLWLLLAFRAFVRGEAAGRIEPPHLDDARLQRSADGSAAGWYDLPLGELPKLLAQPLGENTAGGSFLLRAAYQIDAPEQRADRGFRLERIVRNLTDAKRDGSAAAPFALGDEVLVTFRVLTDRAHAYVALEESLPAAFETVDPEYLRLTLREKLADSAGENRATLSHWEKRDDRTLWYFDKVEAGTLAYGVVVRVTASGRFQWPGAVISPMYDHRCSGTSEGTTIEVR